MLIFGPQRLALHGFIFDLIGNVPWLSFIDDMFDGLVGDNLKAAQLSVFMLVVLAVH